MNINWFTVIAQVINFLILVWLMKRFLYKPILNAIDEREKKIAAQLADAESQKTDAAKELQIFKQKNEELDLAKQELMEQVITDSNAKRKILMEEVRNEIDAFRIKQENRLKEIEEHLKSEIAQRTQKEVYAITRKTLSDLASVSLEEQVTIMFIKRLKELKSEEKKNLKTIFDTTAKPVMVQSAFDLPPKQQTDIQNAFSELLEYEAQFQFRTVAELISGIELSVNGFKISWTISEYLNSLEKSILEIMTEKSKQAPQKTEDPVKIMEQDHTT